ncbi:uncharacterized protein LOC127875144 [Dreissena polymorpha]|uniref:uncharacterized protein LOC127875144 n=1 Tax=Dreissena polymorpha TaxID=45954 RepID=UPI002264A202|nr:uncharacterized protein LOC127875144 [Dreissena polymorpha]
MRYSILQCDSTSTCHRPLVLSSSTLDDINVVRPNMLTVPEPPVAEGPEPQPGTTSRECISDTGSWYALPTGAQWTEWAKAEGIRPNPKGVYIWSETEEDDVFEDEPALRLSTSESSRSSRVTHVSSSSRSSSPASSSGSSATSGSSGD